MWRMDLRCVCTGAGRRTTAGKEIEERRRRLTVDGVIRDSLQAQTEAEGFMEALKQHRVRREVDLVAMTMAMIDDECLVVCTKRMSELMRRMGLTAKGS